MRPARSLYLAVPLLCGALAMFGCSTGRLHVRQLTEPPLEAQDPMAPEWRDGDRAVAAAGLADGDLAHDEAAAHLAGGDGSTSTPRPLTRGYSSDGALSGDAGGLDRDPHTALIGLYGELISGSPDASGQLDGGNNIAQVSFATEGACFDPAIDHTGTLLAFASTMHRPTSDIYLKSTAGKTITQLTTDPADDVMPCFSPDGTRVAFASNRSGNWDVYVMPVDGGGVVQVTSDLDNELHPTWSPDGRMLAYCRYGTLSGRWEIWVTEVVNPGVRHFLEYGLFPEWCPDGARGRILFQRARQRGSRYHAIWTIDFHQGEALHPTEIVSASNAAVINPSWSPNGRRIVFVTVVEPDAGPGARPERSDLWVVNADGAGRTSLTNGQFSNYQPVWASDGAVYFVSNRSGIDNIWAVAAGRFPDLAPGGGGGIANVDPAHQQPQEP
jgi:dipeptidyl aminopeptidase/acylaminoacyl peptidase